MSCHIKFGIRWAHNTFFLNSTSLCKNVYVNCTGGGYLIHGGQLIVVHV